MKKIITAILITAATAAYAQEPVQKDQTRRMAVTTLSENMMRADADYESALETQSLMGTVVEIVDEKSYWRQVNTPEPYTAWCTSLGLQEMTEEEIVLYKAAPKYICTAMHSGVYSEPSASSQRLSDMSLGNLVRIVYTGTGNRLKASCKGRWVEVLLPDGRKGWTPAADVVTFDKWAESHELTAENIVNTARQFTGIPYLWGGASSKGLDCSGLVRLTFFMNGYLLPRNASQQVNYGHVIDMECDHSIAPGSDQLREEMLRRTCNLQAGDLVFFGSPATAESKERVTHVGIYIGNGEIIHASHKVRINSLIPGEKNYYENSHRLLKARRFIGWEGPGMTPIIRSSAYMVR